jgi:hypothetical protein
MATSEAWGYAFDSDHTLAAMVAMLNGRPWVWELRDSSWFGDYLSARPADGCRVRIHDPRQPTQAAPAGGWDGKAPPFRLTAEIGPDAPVSREQIDRAIGELLAELKARDVTPSEPFD